MTETVVVVGGGYGGTVAAKALDDAAEVTLVEPREAFFHNVAALRGVVDPAWTGRLFIPYDGLLSGGRVRRDRAVRVAPGAVELASGAVLGADYIVLATGVSYPYPAKIDVADTAAGLARLRATTAAVARARRVLLLGAGPVGLEFAGEIRAAWPDKAVTIVDPADDLLSGRFPDQFRAQLRAQLDRLGIDLLLGTSLRERPATAPGEVGTVTVATGTGAEITADIWFPCYGAVPRSDILDAELGTAVGPDGHVAVTPQLRVAGQQTVFAIGDVTAVPEMKLARTAMRHAEVVAANIRSLLAGGHELRAHQPEPDAIVLPLGPTGGMTYSPEAGVLGPDVTADLKATFHLEHTLAVLGAVPA